MASDQERIGRRKALAVLGSAVAALGITGNAAAQRATGVKESKAAAPVKHALTGTSVSPVSMDDLLRDQLSPAALPAAREQITARVHGSIKQLLALREPSHDELVAVKHAMLTTEQALHQLADQVAAGAVTPEQARQSAKVQLGAFLNVLNAAGA